MVNLRLPIPTNFRVDRSAGIIHGVALISGGREAKGHGIYIDAQTVAGCLASAQARGGQLKAAIRHPSLLDQLATGGDRVLDLPGYFQNLRIEGEQLVGDVHFYDSFKQSHPAEYQHLLELADKTPGLFGLSVEMSGHAVFIDADGREFSEPPTEPGIVLQHDGMPVFRCTDLYAAAFVDEPAANDGLFARFSRLFSGRRLDLAGLRAVVDSFFDFAAKSGTSLPAPAAPAAPENDTAPKGEAPALESTSDMALLADLHSAFSADPARLARAIKLSVDLGLTVAQITDRLAAEDLELAHAAELSGLRRQVAEANAQLAATKQALTERDAAITGLRSELAAALALVEQLRSSGLPAPVPTGGPSGAALSVVDQWRALEGAERLAFFEQHKADIWRQIQS